MPTVEHTPITLQFATQQFQLQMLMYNTRKRNYWRSNQSSVVALDKFTFVDTQRHADEAAKAVKIVYKEQKPLILTIDQAIEANSFFDVNAVEYTSKAPDTTLKKGDVDGRLLLL